MQIQLGSNTSVTIIGQRHPLAEAIKNTLQTPSRSRFNRAGIVPTVALASSLVTLGAADAAVFEVENLDDAGAGSLRQAIIDANANPGPDAITFADGLSGSIVLSSGSLTISDDLALQGPGSSTVTVSGNNNSRVFETNNSDEAMARVDIAGLTISDGTTNLAGAGIYNSGAEALTIRDSVITNNYAYDGGAGIGAAGGVVQINGSTISNNQSALNGAGIKQSDGSLIVRDSLITTNLTNESGLGAGIYANSLETLVVDGTTVSGNTSVGAGGAIAVDSIEGSILLSNSTITANVSSGNGGGIAVLGFDFYTGDITLDNTQITNNSASDAGGGISVEEGSLLLKNNSLIADNTAYEGGGIFFNDEYAGQILDINNSTIRDNTASEGYGGGILFYAADPDLLIRNSTISGNYASGGGGGVAVYYSSGGGSNEGSITIQNTTVSNNTAGSEGGGFMMEVDETYQPILIEDSEFSGNVAESDGGGLHFYFDDGLYTSLVIRNTTIANNTADDGGGLWFYDDDGYSVVIENSTISGNSAVEDGGGVWFYSDDGAPLILNSTISGNSAGGQGGGLFLTHEDGDGRIDNSTIVDNYAYEDGGGLRNDDSGLAIRSSIIANNTTYSGNYQDISGEEFYVQFSLIENPDGISFYQNTNNLFYIDPTLGPLVDNGGATLTHALLPGSPAIDTGLNAAPAADDQRGIGFDRMVGLQTDMGAIESTSDTPVSFEPATEIVTNLDDAGPGSLRQAIIDTNTNIGPDVIEFQAGLTGTINLTTGNLSISDDLVINAPVPSVITISGDGIATPSIAGEGGDHVFRIYNQTIQGGTLGPASPALPKVDLVGLTISGGNAPNGGGIYASNVELTVRDSVITSNTAQENGGGIFQYRGVVRLIDTTVSNNRVIGEGYGGGIALDSTDEGVYGALVIRGSVISGNNAYEGGGIQTDYGASLAIDDTAITNNTAEEDGGGILINNIGGSVSLSNSIVSNNNASVDGGGIHIRELDENYNLSLTLDNTSVSNNNAGDSGGGIYFESGNDRLRIVNGSQINDNYAYNNGGGIAFEANDDGAALTIIDSTLSNNTAYDGSGGGIHFYTDQGTLNIIDSTISGNSAREDGGGIHVYYADIEGQINVIGSTFNGNTAGDNGGGMLIAGDDLDGRILIENSIFTNNYAGQNGGGLAIYADEGIYVANLEIRDSVFSNNEADNDGGGLFFYDDDGFASLILTNSTISNNTANDDGGGLWFYSDDAGFVIKNTTISNNTATNNGGGIFNQYSDGPDNIDNSSIVQNQADYGGGLSSTLSFASDMTIRSSIVSGNTATTAGSDVGGDATFYFEFSVLGDDTDVGNITVTDNGFNQLGVDPLIGALTDNGGPTETHALMPGSPAINRGLNFAATVNDQRSDGFPRTVGLRTDIGAVEGIENLNLATNLTGSPIAENLGMATVDATLSEAAGQPLIIDLDFTGVAILDTDFSVDSSAVFIPDGELASLSPATITAIDDNITEGDEAFSISSTVITAGTSLGGIPLLNGVITDNEGPPTVTLSLVGDPIVENAGVAIITATLSNPSTQDVTSTLLFSGTADASDFAAANTIVIPAGMLTSDINLTAQQDVLDEPDETVIVDIDSVTNGVENGIQQVTTTITDDDEAPLVTISLSVTDIGEGGTADVILTLNTVSGQDIDIELGFSGTATMPDDYTVSSNMVTIPAGQTTGIVTIMVVDDGLGDPNETIIIDILSATNATEDGVQQGTINILEPTAVPSMSTWGKLAMLLMMPLTAFVAMRRRRQQK